MKRTLALALVACLVGCGEEPVVLTQEDGTRWDGHLAIGEQRTIGGQHVIDTFSGYEVRPVVAMRVEDPSIATIAPDTYGFRIVGVATGTTTLHLYAVGDVSPVDTSITVGRSP